MCHVSMLRHGDAWSQAHLLSHLDALQWRINEVGCLPEEVWRLHSQID